MGDNNYADSQNPRSPYVSKNAQMALQNEACPGRSEWLKIESPKATVTVWKMSTSAFLFTSGMTIDADGSPRAYHPNNTGLDDNQNAKTSKGAWVGVVSVDGKPVIQGPIDPAPGFYVSGTTLHDRTKKVSDPRRYVDSETVPYIALPPRVLGPAGAGMGDFAAVMNRKNGSVAFAIVADQGPRNRIGEGSIALAKALGINSNARVGGVAGGIVYIVFSGSGNGQPRSVEEINSKAGELLNAFGGPARLKSCGSER